MFKRAVFGYKVLIVFTLLFCSNIALAGKIIYVDKDASKLNTGSSWEGAKWCLRDALDQAQAGDEIRVAQGTHKPDESFEAGRFPKIVSSGDRYSSFILKTGVTLNGGYAGYGEPDPDARDISLYETILSGDLDGNDVSVDDPCDLLYEPTRSENSYHVVKSHRVDETAVIDGFTIIGGNANDSSNYGGGMNIGDNPTILNCTFKNNSSRRYGGAVYYNANEEHSIFTNCKFIGNSSEKGGGVCFSNGSAAFTDCSFTGNSASDIYYDGLGGGLYSAGNNVQLINCTFYYNTAVESGGGVHNQSDNMMLHNCRFICNSAEMGAGLNNFCSGSILTNCIFSANSAELNGGAICHEDSDLTGRNCVFFNNRAENGNALAVFDMRLIKSLGIININNCILWDGGDEINNDFNSILTITYSDIEGGWESLGNINVDPCFASPGFWDSNNTPEDSNDDFWVEGDYHLKSQAGRFDVNTQSWVIDDVTSQCIDAGDPLSPIGHELCPNNGVINMGLYGGTEQASMSLNDVINFPKPGTPNPPDYAIDVNLDDNLTWSSDANAIAHEIYFGTNDLPPFVLKDYKNKFDPGVLLPNTQYYWRIDNIDSMLRRTVGDTWTFLTGPMPDYAYNPIPENGSDNVLPDSLFSWIPGCDAFLHTIYFDTDYDKVNDANIYNTNGVKYFAIQNEAYFSPGILEPNQTYYWRVDEQDNYNYTRGEIWTFKTGSIPFKAYNPYPEHGAVNVNPGRADGEDAELLSWTSGFNTVRHDVYFGSNYNSVNNATIANPMNVLVSIGQGHNYYQPKTLEYYKVYYWRVDEIDSSGIVTKGDIWMFTTKSHPSM